MSVAQENFFGHIQRYPCLINNYERSIASSIKDLSGLLLFVMSMSLAKKINKIIEEKNNKEKKIEREKNNEKQKEIVKLNKQKKYEKKQEQKKLAEKNKT